MKKIKDLIYLSLLSFIMIMVLGSCGSTEESSSSNSKHTHDYGITYVYDESRHWYQCSCGFKIQSATHVFGDWITVTEPTETSVGSQRKECEKCNYEKVEEIPMVHVHKYTSVINDPKCEVVGFTKYTCECGDSYRGDFVDALEHDIVIDEAVEPTCTTTGLTEGKHCSICNKKFLKQKEIPVLDHIFENDSCINCNLKYSKGLKFELVGSAYKVIGIGECDDEEVIIPSSYNGLAVTSIGKNAFFRCKKIKKIVIPNSVTCIDEYAFNECTSLTNIVIPNSVTEIGRFAFDDCDNIKYNEYNRGYYLGNSSNPYLALVYVSKTADEVEIHKDVKIICYQAFADAAYIKNIEIPDSVIYIGEYAFKNCKSLTSIVIPDTITTIKMYTFVSCTSLTSVKLPQNLITIEKNAFAACTSLTSIEIPDTVTAIYDDAFSGCYYLSDIKLSNNLTIIGAYAFDYSHIKEIIIPSSVIKIGDGAFEGCQSLVNVIFEEESKLTYIGERAFSGCKFESISIPNTVTRIGAEAFSGNNYLVNVTIPNTGITMGEYVFNNCKKIKYNEDEFGYYLGDLENPYVVLIEAKSLNDGTYTVNSNVKNIGSYIFKRLYHDLEKIIIPKSVITVGEHAFQSCNVLSSVTFEEGSQLESIGSYAFANCSSLVEINIPQGVKCIEEGTFSSCSNLININLPEGVTSIGKMAFYSCSSLVNMSLPNGVLSFDYGIFHSCDNLREIIIPNTLTYMDNYSLKNCDNLSYIYYTGSINDWENIEILEDLDLITSGTIYYYSESKPIEEGNYWHYDTDGITPVIWE